MTIMLHAKYYDSNKELKICNMTDVFIFWSLDST